MINPLQSCQGATVAPSSRKHHLGPASTSFPASCSPQRPCLMYVLLNFLFCEIPVILLEIICSSHLLLVCLFFPIFLRRCWHGGLQWVILVSLGKDWVKGVHGWLHALVEISLAFSLLVMEVNGSWCDLIQDDFWAYIVRDGVGQHQASSFCTFLERCLPVAGYPPFLLFNYCFCWLYLLACFTSLPSYCYISGRVRF